MKDKEKQFKERIDYGIAYCEDTPNKQIEEIETIIKSNLAEGSFANAFARKVAIQIVEHYQPKLPEDSVVLSREEYEKLRSLYDCEQGSYMTSNIGDLPLTVEGLRKAVDEITRLNRVESELQELNIKYYNEAKDLRRELKQARKETAEKIYTKIKDSFLMNSNNRYALKLWIEEQFGLEIKE